MKNLKLALAATLAVGSINAANQAALVKCGLATPVVAVAVPAGAPAKGKGVVTVQGGAVEGSAEVGAKVKALPTQAPQVVSVAATMKAVAINPFTASKEATFFDSIKAIFGFKRAPEQLVYEKFVAVNGDLSKLSVEERAIFELIIVPAKHRYIDNVCEEFVTENSIAGHMSRNAVKHIKGIVATGDVQGAVAAQQQFIAQTEKAAAQLNVLKSVMNDAIPSYTRDYERNPARKAAEEARLREAQLNALRIEAQACKEKHEKDKKALEARHQREHRALNVQIVTEDKELDAKEASVQVSLRSAKRIQEHAGDVYFGSAARPPVVS